jgi:predicted nucleic acid-binding protein
MEMNKALLIDTNAYAEFFKGNEFVKNILENCKEIHLCPIVEGELKFGFKNGKKLEKNLKEFEAFTQVDKVIRIPINEIVSDHYSEIILELKKKGTPIPTNDVWICACAKAYNLPVLTFDKHFRVIEGIRLINQ